MSTKKIYNRTSRRVTLFVLNITISIILTFYPLLYSYLTGRGLRVVSAQTPPTATPSLTPSLTPSPTPPVFTVSLANQIRSAAFDTQKMYELDGFIRGRSRILDLSRDQLLIKEEGYATEMSVSPADVSRHIIYPPFVVSGIAYSLVYISELGATDNLQSIVIAVVNVTNMNLEKLILMDIYEYEKRIDIMSNGARLESYDTSGSGEAELVYSSLRPNWVGTKIGDKPFDSTPTSTPFVIPTITVSPSAAPPTNTATPTRTPRPATLTPVATSTFWTLLPTQTPVPGTTPCYPYSPDPDLASFTCAVKWAAVCNFASGACTAFCTIELGLAAPLCGLICNIICGTLGWLMCDTDLEPCPTWTPEPTSLPDEDCSSIGCTICCLSCISEIINDGVCSQCRWVAEMTPPPNATNCTFCDLEQVIEKVTECAASTPTPTPYVPPTSCPYRSEVCQLCFPRPAGWPGGPTKAPGSCALCLSRCIQELMQRGCREGDIDCIDSNEFCHASRRTCKILSRGTAVPVPTWMPTPLWWPTATPTP